MTRVVSCAVVFFALAGLCWGASGNPNIVLIMADDLGWSDVGAYGSEIETLNIDRLADEGVRFSQFHNTAKCFTTRASLLTGLYHHQTGLGRKPERLTRGVTIGQLLRQVGYRTLWSGKHHGTQNPINLGFDRYYGLRDGSCNYFNPGKQRAGEGVPAHKSGKFQPRAWCIDGKTFEPYTPEAEDFYTTDYFTNYALEWLSEYEGEERPFFLYLAYTAPHDPLQAWPEDIAKYRGRYRAGFEAIRTARYERQKKLGLIDESFPLSAPVYGKWEELSDEEKDNEDNVMAVYAAMIDRMDQNIGRVLARIEAMGELDNTLVIFLSDNGCARGGFVKPDSKNYNSGAGTTGEIGSMTRWTRITPSWANVSNTPYRKFKTASHKGGTCTPLIMRWPRGIKGSKRVSHQVGHVIDIVPTLLDVTGATYRTGPSAPALEGRSLLAIFQGRETIGDRGPLYWQWSQGKAIRSGDWRLVSDDRGPWALYDMRVDKTETTDLAGEKPRLARGLESEYNEWYRRMLREAGIAENR